MIFTVNPPHGSNSKLISRHRDMHEPLLLPGDLAVYHCLLRIVLALLEDLHVLFVHLG